MENFLNKTEAAKSVGISRTRLDRLIEKHLVTEYTDESDEREILINIEELQKALIPQPIGFTEMMDYAFRIALECGYEDQIAHITRNAIDIHTMAEEAAKSVFTNGQAAPYEVSAFIGTYMQGYQRGFLEQHLE